MPASRTSRKPFPARTVIAAAVFGALAGSAGSPLAASFNWLAGNYPAGGLPNPILADDTVFASGAGDKNFSGIALTIQGGLVWQGDARLGLASSSITNSSLIEIAGNASLQYIGGNASTLANNNTFRKSAGSGTTAIGANINFTNAGVIDAQTGTIDFVGGLATFNAGTQFVGAGVNRVSSNANFGGAISSANLVLAGGTWSGTAAVLSGTTSWSGGQFSGTWSLPASAVLTAVAGSDKNFSGANFTNAANGTIVWTTAERIGFASSTLANAGLIDIQADANLTYIAGNASTLTNSGTFRKSAGSGTTAIGANINFTNAGVIDAQTGTIDFVGGLATFNAGTQFVGAGVNRISSNATFAGTIQSSNLVLAAGAFNGNAAQLQGNASWTGGQFTGGWLNPSGSTIQATSGTDKNFSGTTFTNSGTLAWATANRMGFASTTLQNTGLIDIQADANLTYIAGNASTLTNSGTFRKSAGSGTTAIGANINFTNAGVIDAQTGTIDFSGGSATFNAGTQFIGAGVNRINSNATFNGAFTASNLVLAGGNFSSGPAGATIQGSVAWTGGSFVGAWNLASGQSLSASGSSDKNFSGAAFSNAGTVSWATGARIGFASSILQNNSLFDLQADASLVYVAGNASTFNNNATGIFRKSGGTGTSTVGTNIFFRNSGVIDARTGTIDFAGHSAEFLGGTQFTGDGVVQVSGNAAFTGTFTSGNLRLTAGNFSGSAAVARGTTRWTGGQFVGTWQIDPGQTLLALDGADKNFTGTNATNQGTLSWQTANRLGFASAAVTNQGLLDIQADANLVYVGGNASTFVNQGTFRKSGGSGTTTIGTNIQFTNPGTIEALSGTLVLPQNFTNPGKIKGNAVVQTNVLTNTGVLAPGASPGMLTLAGNLVMTSAGSLDIELESTSLHDMLAVTGSALLDGTLVVRRYGAYAPKVGDTFTILTYAQRVGASEFDALTTLGFGGGVLFDVSYGANSVTLSVAAVPEPETYVLMLLGLAAVAAAARRSRRRTGETAAA